MSDNKINIRFGKGASTGSAGDIKPPANSAPTDTLKPEAPQPTTPSEPSATVDSTSAPAQEAPIQTPAQQLSPPPPPPIADEPPAPHTPGDTFHPESGTQSSTEAKTPPQSADIHHTAAPASKPNVHTNPHSEHSLELDLPKKSFTKGFFKFFLYLILLILIGAVILVGLIFFFER